MQQQQHVVGGSEGRQECPQQHIPALEGGRHIGGEQGSTGEPLQEEVLPLTASAAVHMPTEGVSVLAFRASHLKTERNTKGSPWSPPWWGQAGPNTRSPSGRGSGLCLVGSKKAVSTGSGTTCVGNRGEGELAWSAGMHGCS